MLRDKETPAQTRSAQTVFSAVNTDNLGRLSFGLTVAALLARMLISANTLLNLHIDYASAGGNPVIKIHLGTYLAALALGVTLVESGDARAWLRRYVRSAAGNIIFMIMIVFCIVHMLLSVGKSGAAVYIDSFLCAGLVAMLIEHASIRQRRILAWVYLGVTSANVLVGVMETLTQSHLIPYASADLAKFEGQESEFRGVALHDHPLSAALVTMLGVFLLLQMRPRALVLIPLFLLHLLGLVAFGGRTALGVTAITLSMLGAAYLVRESATRQLGAKAAASALLAATLLPILGWYVLTQTPIGVRINGRLFFDESAAARNQQWAVLNMLPFEYLLMGTPLDASMDYSFQLGMVDFENFWLASFIALGIIGSTYFLLGFIPFMIHLWRIAPFFGRVMLVTSVLVASTSSSLARKSSLLVTMTGMILASTAFARGRSEQVRTPLLQRPNLALTFAGGPASAVPRGMRVAQPGAVERRLRPSWGRPQRTASTATNSRGAPDGA